MIGFKVFSATLHREREYLGDRFTEWLRDHPEATVDDVVITQSSDQSHHCLTITVRYIVPETFSPPPPPPPRRRRRVTS
jgi:hypothetical protein